MSVQTYTPEEAAQKLRCPNARIMHPTCDNGMCVGEKCAAWRFLPLLASDPSFVSAVQREILILTEEYKVAGKASSPNVLHNKAVERVARDPSAYSIPGHHERGYCGLGGRPNG